MVPTRQTPTLDTPPERKASVLLSVAAGILASLVLSFIPFSTVLGGFVAGYLRGGTGTDGAFVGGIVGVVTFAPFAVIFYLILGFVALGGAPSIFSAVVLTMFLAVGLYTVGASVAGGFLGAYLADELDRSVPVLDDI
ncbi:hypothetical protein GRX03_08060 [Halovenus sp. WSH3]|uniref:DUF5518 domain-containing protein n=1 Tax=Halovenus carboxidivorans TaxID=2692199 RepID=A0A6B0T5T8_9EURY|nr:DUF5518 domain-containing protein [Halovenus carboxidivorans]MXR51556.1 hypothetical protein [Halovenus carboxidivorans]